MRENSTNNSDAQYIDLVVNSFDKINSYKEAIKDLMCTNVCSANHYVISKDYDFGRVVWDTLNHILAITSSNGNLGIQWDCTGDYNACVFVESDFYTRWYVRKKKDSSRKHIKPLLEEYPNLGYFILRIESNMSNVINWLKGSL